MIRRPDSGELWDFSAPSTTVKPFGITLLTDCERRVDKNFDKIIAAHYAPCIFSMLGLGRNRCGDGNKSVSV